MKLVKILSGLLALLVITVAAVVFYVYSHLNDFVKDAVETFGPQVTQTEVQLNRVDIKLAEGRLNLQGFSIANPHGFSSANIVDVNNVVMQLDIASLQQPVIVIKEITIDGVGVLAEEKNLTTNIQALMDALPKGTTNNESATSEEAAAGQDLRFMVEQINFTNNSVSLISEHLGRYQLSIPSFSQVNIGTRDKGLSPVELGNEILKPLLKRAQKTAEKRLKDAAQERLGIDADAEIAKQKQRLKEEQQKLLDKAKGKLGDDADKKVNALKSLFK